jgi:hypothetical protein
VTSGYGPITQCEDNTFCCGLDNTTCCQAGHGKLLGPHGQRISAKPSTTTITSTSPAVPTHPNSGSNRGSKIALGVGLGVALPLAVSVLVMGALLFLRRKNPPDEPQRSPDPGNEAMGELEDRHNAHELKVNNSVHELRGVTHEVELDVERVSMDGRG